LAEVAASVTFVYREIEMIASGKRKRPSPVRSPSNWFGDLTDVGSCNLLLMVIMKLITRLKEDSPSAAAL